ncbi:sugar ABC transporter permease [Acrocarpospora pleiomorpha]|uniref:Maltose/maltodextrin transport system permease protein n=1 Tax=Acrocarpospora pleiomorpha TaxID=90975 RepID=A0A5M3XNG9_9ACTN|nr:sugar ABC transporter permease [Acrocarpospora pleiomorpha]
MKATPRAGYDSPPSGHRRVLPRPRRELSTGFVVSRILVLAVGSAVAFYAAPPLIAAESWTGLTVLAAATALIAYIYLSRRHLPLKYLVPGTVFLIAFQIFPVLFTLSTAFTNFGEGHRGTKEEAITSIQTSSVAQVPGSPEYNLSVAVRDGELVFLLVDTATKQVQAGTAAGLEPVSGAELGLTGKVLSAPGFQVLTIPQAAARGAEISALTVPTAEGAIKANGLSRAFEGRAAKAYAPDCDCVTDSATGQKWTADPDEGAFVAADGSRLAQGWQVNVGFSNFTRVFTDPRISAHFLSLFAWDLLFAAASVLGTFGIGLIAALALHGVKVRGTRLYRVLLVLPHAMPAFAMFLVWRDMFNTDFGLINRVLGLHTDWFGEPVSARFAVILVNLWLGFPYMFLVTTGALQAIPSELGEAARIDGATPWHNFRRVTLPLLLIAVTPLLISSFAFNFNNFNAIRLTTNGAPFSVDNTTVGGTDLLITYTFRLAFEGGSAEFGFAAAISVFIFILVGIISALAFRRTRYQEEVYA